MPEFTRDETLDDILSELEKETGTPSEKGAGGEVPVGRHIREFREKTGLTHQQFAEKVGITSALLTQMENRMVSPSIGMLVQIANAFGTTVSSFIGGKEECDYSIVRKEDHTSMSRVGLKEGGKTPYVYESLGAGKAGRKMEPFLLRLHPMSEPPTARSVHDGEEFLYVLSGEVEVLLGSRSELLKEGDCIYYNSSTPHHVHSAREEEATVLAVLYAGK
ncbi:MAG: XRE family transcriptional regulator [Thermodesulfobacteriota bacterium]